MFDTLTRGVELSEPEVLAGEGEDELAYLATVDELATGWIPSERHVLPDDLESITAGPFLTLILASVDRSKLNSHDVVRLLEAEARLEAAATSEKLASVAEIAHCLPGNADSEVERSPDPVEYAEAEVAAALSLTRRNAQTLMERALWLHTSGPRVREALSRGDISERKADVFRSGLSHLDFETVDHVLDQLLEPAAHLTTGQLAHRVSKQVMTSDPSGAKSSMKEGLEDRKLVGLSNPDFTGCVHICTIHPWGASGALSHVDKIARKLRQAGDERPVDQLRADVAVDLLRGIDPLSMDGDTPTGGSVHLTVPLVTLAELSDMPGDLAGYAPVIADIARQIALQQTKSAWTWTITHNDRAIATGTTRYRPTASQTRQAHGDYQTCVHPGCRMPATNCDLDHRDPRSHGGRTHNDNLAPLCRYHHMMRHHTPWEYNRLPDGNHQWTSPLGHNYFTRRGPPEAA